jgi:3-deoxy-D-manno-octulosonic-acid transferase
MHANQLTLRPGLLVGAAAYTYGFLVEALALGLLPLGPIWHNVRRLELAERRRALAAAAGPAGRRCVWVHAASLGEAGLLCRFLSVLRERHPEDWYLVTCVTRTGLDYLRRHELPRVLGLGLMPLDSVGRMRELVRRFGVKRLWTMETELWPGMLWACLRSGVAVGIANARMEEKSRRGYQRFAWLMRPLFASLDLVLAQDERYAARFVAMGVARQRVRVMGNLKARVVVEPTSVELRRALRRRLGVGESEFVLTAGCLHPGEGSVVRDALACLRRQGRAVRCIVVPRHRERAAALAAELGEGTLRLIGTSTDAPWEVCLIDKYGILDDMYALADAAVVGGTFVPVGGHNPWDAARYGIPVFFGPLHHTQQQGCDRLRQAGAGFAVEGADDMARALASVLDRGRLAFAAARDRLAAALAVEAHGLTDLLP